MKNEVKMMDNAAWGGLYSRLRDRLVKGLDGWYCLADREDAVECAFDKLMHRMDHNSNR